MVVPDSISVALVNGGPLESELHEPDALDGPLKGMNSSSSEAQ